MTRFPDWPARLEAFLLEREGRKFAYGSWDCGLFVADAIQAMTGVDPAAALRGTYASRFEAIEAIARWTGGRRVLAAIAETIASRSDMPETPVSRASRGDVLLIRRSRGHSLALMALDGYRALAVSRAGIVALKKYQADRAWRVG